MESIDQLKTCLNEIGKMDVPDSRIGAALQGQEKILSGTESFLPSTQCSFVNGDIILAVV